MTIEANDFYQTLNAWYPSSMSKFYELTSFLLSTITMECTSDIVYEKCSVDGSLKMIIIGVQESIILSYRGNKNDDYILYITYYTRRKNFELNHGDEFYWEDFRTGKWYSWSDKSIPMDKRRLPVYDKPEWEMNDKSLILMEYEGMKTSKYFQEIKKILASNE